MIKRVLLLGSLMCMAFAGIAAEPQSVTLDVKGMHCGTCPLTVRQLLKNQPGVNKAEVDAKGQTATVEFDPAKVTPDALAKATTEAGYPATVKK